MRSEELRELWEWAAPTSAGIVGPMLEEDGAFEDDFTIAEREAGVEKVVTGLRRRLDDEDEDEDEEEDEEEEEADKMEDVMSGVPSAAGPEEANIDPKATAIPLEGAFRFATIGTRVGNQ